VPRAATYITGRNLVVAGRRTTVRLDSVMWEAFRDIARRRECTVHALATDIACNHSSPHGLSSAIRDYIVRFYRDAARNLES
jgi:predicted DNA-binding ribbon-helix-helix protein